MSNLFHKPVLLQTAIDFLQVGENQKYIDLTIGGGGHTAEILKKGGIVLGIDQDREALHFCQDYLGENYKSQLILAKSNFKNIETIAKKYGFTRVNGILFDLGVSSYQLDSKIRGFSFRKEARLDMRMDKDTKISAFEIINNESFETLVKIFMKYGEDPHAEYIAHLITQARSHKAISSTKELADIISKTYISNKNYKMKIHPATRIFQALRIAVNDELEVLREGLKESVKLLVKGGRLVVISYHSLEDRIVKLSMRSESLKILTKNPLLADSVEIRQNPRARSAKLRAAQKI